MTIDTKEFIDELLAKGYDYFTGVPGTYISEPIHELIKRDRWNGAFHEGSALAQAVGAYLAGKKPIVFLSSSGFTNLLNPLLSLCIPYDIPMSFVMGMRTNDLPQHKEEWKVIDDILAHFYGRYSFVAASSTWVLHDFTVDRKYKIFLVDEKDAFTKVENTIKDDYYTDYPSRYEAIDEIFAHIKDDDIVLCGIGLTSRYVYNKHDRNNNFYMIGSMGHLASIAKGLGDIFYSAKRIIIIDGDGSTLMHLSSLINMDSILPIIKYFVLANGTYGSTGHQPLPVEIEEELSSFADNVMYTNIHWNITGAFHLDAETSFTVVNINNKDDDKIYSERMYSPAEIAKQFRENIIKGVNK